MRARKLIESKCDKLAMNFITEALRVIQLCTNEHLLRRTVSLLQHQNLLEMYFSLLWKFKQSSHLKSKLEAMEIESAKEFILNSFATVDAYEAQQKQRSAKLPANKSEPPKVTCAGRLHKYHLSVTQYALQLILVRLLSGVYGADGDNGLDIVFQHLLTEWIRRHKDRGDFYALFQKLVQTSATNAVTYDCCEILFAWVSFKLILYLDLKLK